jgi:NADH:ubiquinone oxidoreductase subunit H
MKAQDIVASLRGLAGGIAGGVAGYYLFFWILHNYARAGWMIPGAFLGLGWGLASRHRSLMDGMIAAIFAAILGLWTAHRAVAPNQEFTQFVLHAHKLLIPLTIVMITLGVALAFWFGLGREPRKTYAKGE